MILLLLLFLLLLNLYILLLAMGLIISILPRWYMGINTQMFENILCVLVNRLNWVFRMTNQMLLMGREFKMSLALILRRMQVTWWRNEVYKLVDLSKLIMDLVTLGLVEDMLLLF